MAIARYARHQYDWELMLKRIGQGVSQRKIAKEMGVSYGALRKAWARKLDEQALLFENPEEMRLTLAGLGMEIMMDAKKNGDTDTVVRLIPYMARLTGAYKPERLTVTAEAPDVDFQVYRKQDAIEVAAA